MQSLMAETVQARHWYLAVGDRSIGPLTTELVARGIESGKVPLTAWICQVGANAWSALSSFGEFQDIVDRVLAADVPANQRSGERAGAAHPPPKALQAAPTLREVAASEPMPAVPETAADAATGFGSTTAPDEEETTERHSALPYELPDPQAFTAYSQSVDESDFVTSAASAGPSELETRDELPSFIEQSGQREVAPELREDFGSESGAEPSAAMKSFPSDGPDEFNQAIAAARAAARVSHDDLGIDITFDEDHENAIDWKERFQSYFLVGTEVELPEEHRLLQSLRETPRATFLHDEALWNLSLCLAFGSEEVAATSARTFFEALGPDHAPERIEWICRTLLSKGFMPSGIPRSEGMRGIDVLRGACVAALSEVLEREAVD